MNNVATWIRQDLEELQDDPEFLTQTLLLEVNENICALMDEQGISRAELARRLKWQRSAVTKMLQGNHNISILRLVKVALALGCTLTAPQFVPRAVRLQLHVSAGTDGVPRDAGTYLSKEITLAGVRFQPLEMETDY